MPPEVGADRIARTARAALELLAAHSRSSNRSRCAGLEPGQSRRARSRSTRRRRLRSRGIAYGGYKGDPAPAARRARPILERLQPELRAEIQRELLTENDDLLDAVRVRGRGRRLRARPGASSRATATRAEREGWIWFRGRGQRELFE